MFLAILLILCGLCLSLNLLLSPKKEWKNNHYIRDHEKKLKDDKLYEDYMKWCFKHGEAPMDKKGFDSIRDKEKYVNSFIRKF